MSIDASYKYSIPTLLSRAEDTSNGSLATQYIYTTSQYNAIINTTVAASTISLLASLLITVGYLYLRSQSPEKANRVSLRCVFMASFMNLINAVFEIAAVITYGNTAFCSASGLIVMFAQATSASFLSLVGINLMLVFVVNIDSPVNRLEWIYYPCAIVYGLVAISVPIYVESTSPIISSSDYQCYYYIHYYQMIGGKDLVWIWFYGFLFMAIVIAMVCSVIALVKLMHENHLLIGNLTTIANNSQSFHAANCQIQQRIKLQSNILVRVASRCLLYPLVPFLCNVWGFAFQLVLVNSQNRYTQAFPLSITNALFKCLLGFFVAIVFFIDPTMAQFISEQLKQLKSKYVDEFTPVKKSSVGQAEILDCNKTHPSSNDIDYFYEQKNKDINCLSITASNNTYPLVTTSPYQNKSIVARDSFTQEESVCEQQDDSAASMCKVNVPEPVYTCISNNRTFDPFNNGSNV